MIDKKEFISKSFNFKQNMKKIGEKIEKVFETLKAH